MREIIKISGLSKVYQNRSVLKDIDLTIEKGEFICIIGSSGGGKSTLLNLIGGFLENDGGEVRINNKIVDQASRDCIMVFQEFDQLFAWKTVKENVEFPLKKSPHAYSREEKSSLSAHYLKMVKLEEFSSFYPYQLSGGMKQRCAIARALVTTPQVLLMDEPFGSLDIKTKQDLQEILRAIWKKTQTTILFVTHDVREALNLADRIVLLADQQIKAIIDNKDKGASDQKMPEIISLMSS